MKTITALIAASVITGSIAVAMLGIGTNAIFNKNSVPVADSQTSSVNVSKAGQQAISQVQVKQLQDRISQYQSREQQYQEQINELIQRVNQDNTQIQAYKALIEELQRQDMIAIRRDGTVLFNHEREHEFDDD